MTTTAQRPALLDLPHVAEFLGQPLSSVRRWIHRPPTGFPQPVRLGAKITFRTAELEAWALGTVGTTSAQPAHIEPALSPSPRPRGRPRKQAQGNVIAERKW
jgi:predicted DNA-binding transcriptional regulator AlpA